MLQYYTRPPVVTVLLLAFVLSSSQATSTKWCMKAKQAQKKGMHLDCSSKSSSGGDAGAGGASGGRIVSLSVVGSAGECKGLTARMFVEMNTCLWKERCTIWKKKSDKYMVKLYNGTHPQCLIKPVKKFYVTYHCAASNVPVVDVLSQNSPEVTELKGILRSHEDHPWMYHRKHQNWRNDNVTLRNPDPASLHFVYTIRKLRLMWEDSLNVEWTDHVDKFTTQHHHDVINTTRVITGAERVTFRLDMTPFSPGERASPFAFNGWRTPMWKTPALE